LPQPSNLIAIRRQASGEGPRFFTDFTEIAQLAGRAAIP